MGAVGDVEFVLGAVRPAVRLGEQVQVRSGHHVTVQLDGDPRTVSRIRVVCGADNVDITIDAGNVTGDTRFDGTVFGYAYDGDGRLASVTRNGLAEAAYGYDSFQRRVLKSTGGITRHFLHDPDGYLLAEAGSAGDVASEWFWLGDRPLAVVADVDSMSPRLL